MGKLHRRVTRKPHSAFLTKAVGLRLKTASGDTLVHLHGDHLGSTTALSDSSSGYGVSGSRARYLPFGDWRTEPTVVLTDRGYTGQQHNDELGLIYYNARFYAP